MAYNVNTYIGGKPINSEKIIIGQKAVYEVLNKYLRNAEARIQTKIS